MTFYIKPTNGIILAANDHKMVPKLQHGLFCSRLASSVSAPFSIRIYRGPHNGIPLGSQSRTESLFNHTCPHVIICLLCHCRHRLLQHQDPDRSLPIYPLHLPISSHIRLFLGHHIDHDLVNG